MTFMQIEDSGSLAAEAANQPHSILPLILFFGVIPLGFMIYCLKDILPKRFSGNGKKIWLILIIILPMLGPLMYLFVGQDKAIK